MKDEEKQQIQAKYGSRARRDPGRARRARDLRARVEPGRRADPGAAQATSTPARSRNWKELGGPDAPITLYGRENNSGTYVFFKEHVLDDGRLRGRGADAARHRGGGERGRAGPERHRLRRRRLRQGRARRCAIKARRRDGRPCCPTAETVQRRHLSALARRCSSTCARRPRARSRRSSTACSPTAGQALVDRGRLLPGAMSMAPALVPIDRSARRRGARRRRARQRAARGA